MDADSYNEELKALPILDGVLREEASRQLKAYGCRDHGFVDLRQIPTLGFFNSWLDRGFHGEMKWMERTARERADVRFAFPQYFTALVITIPYDSQESTTGSELNQVSRYAQGRDYHKVIRKILKNLFQDLQILQPALEGRTYVDTGPLSEKHLASFAGLGWIGKNTNLISHQHGSLFFLGVLLLNCICTDFSEPTDHCGTCTRCIDVCPTDAIVEPYIIDSRLCLSHETIERVTPTSTELQQKGNWIYGCDDCQTCCPYNRFSKPTKIEDFQPRDYSIEKFLNLDEDSFLKFFEGSPIRRTGYEHFLENVLAQVAKNPAKYKEHIISLANRTTSERIKKRIKDLFGEK